MNPPIVNGPYNDLQLAKDELKQIAKNGKSRMIVEVINGIIREDPHMITGISQTSSNGFEKDWNNWDDIHEMVDILHTIHPETQIGTSMFGTIDNK